MKKALIALTFGLVLGLSAQNVMAQPYSGPMATDSCETGAGGTAVETPCQTGSSLEVYEAIEFIFSTTGTPSLGLTSNASADSLQVVGSNGYWNQLGGGTPSDVAVIAIGAGNTNKLGVYGFGAPGAVTYIAPPQTGTKTLGLGTVSDPFPGGTIPSLANFGFALNSTGASGSKTWYSDPTLNSDGIDHMLAFALPQLEGSSIWIDTDNDGIGDSQVTFAKNAFLLAWEDRAANHPSFDSDYNDTIFLISRITRDPPPTNSVPEPLTMALMGSGLVGMVGMRRKRS